VWCGVRSELKSVAMSSSDSSPQRRFGGSGYDLDYVGTGADPNFTAEISNKMRVPRKIRVGDSSENDDPNNGWGQSQWSRSSLGYTAEKYAPSEMRVPDRIMVSGQDQHYGSKALPRELQLELQSNQMPIPPDPETIRIITPPRQITLLNSRPESNMSTDGEETGDDDTLIVENNKARFGNNESHNNGAVVPYQERNSFSRRNKIETAMNGDVNEEIMHLREQLSRMNRRMLALEGDSGDRKEREKYVAMVGVLYLTFKVVSWLFRSGNHH